MTARVIADDDVGRRAAIEVIGRGGIVAIPTDTVYGIAARLDDAAIERLFAAKRRPADRAIVLAVDDEAQIGALAEWPPAARALAAAFWPGGLTIVAPQLATAGLPASLSGGRPTIGIRQPDHGCPRALARALGPLPLTSANVSDLPAARDAAEVGEHLGDAVDLIVDGGPALLGVASTVVECRADGGVGILRPGVIASDRIAAALAASGLPALAE